jgi:hypothetical protein
MSCTKNPKKFLWMTYKGLHKWKIVRISKFMEYVSTDYIVKSECLFCGAETVEHFVSHEELLERGLTNEQIKSRNI